MSNKENIKQLNGFTTNVNYYQTKKYFSHCLKNNILNVHLQISNQNPNKTKLANSVVIGKLINFTDHHIVVKLSSVNGKSADRRDMMFYDDNNIKDMFDHSLGKFHNTTTSNNCHDKDYIQFASDKFPIDKEYFSCYNGITTDNDYSVKEFINIFDIELFKCTR